MEWRAEGVLLSLKRHGESAAILDVLTEQHGRHAGLLRGATSRSLTPHLQPGAQLALTWRARLEDHLGSFSAEPLRGRAAQLLDDRLALAGLSSVTALAAYALPERAADSEFYHQTLTVLDLLGTSSHWPYAYLLWERSLLERAGFGLSLDKCAVTGDTEDLAYVSPKSGRAVSRAGAGAWADRLLHLPPCLRAEGPPDAAGDIIAGLVTTGHFLEKRLPPQRGGRPLPPARLRLVEALSRTAAAS